MAATTSFHAEKYSVLPSGECTGSLRLAPTAACCNSLNCSVHDR